MKILKLGLLALVLTGCAHKIWYQPGVGRDQTEQDLARAKLLYNLTHSADYTAGGMVYQSVESGNFIDNYMLAHGYHKVPVSQATNTPVRLGSHAD